MRFLLWSQNESRYKSRPTNPSLTCSLHTGMVQIGQKPYFCARRGCLLVVSMALNGFCLKKFTSLELFFSFDYIWQLQSNLKVNIHHVYRATRWIMLVGYTKAGDQLPSWVPLFLRKTHNNAKSWEINTNLSLASQSEHAKFSVLHRLCLIGIGVLEADILLLLLVSYV